MFSFTMKLDKVEPVDSSWALKNSYYAGLYSIAF
jgi:hypothetical protein